MKQIERLREDGCYRTFPQADLYDSVMRGTIIDFSSNDYMGLGGCEATGVMTSSASRMLAVNQSPYIKLETLLKQMYNRPALLFNSGYHVNTGIIAPLSEGNTLIISDKLVHASIIDGIKLAHSKKVLRFKHNDMDMLKKIVSANHDLFDRLLVITESIFSMDGDKAPVSSIIELKKYYPKLMLYVDIAHSIGAAGWRGIGFESMAEADEVDVIVGTFGKSCASMGAFVVANKTLIDYIRNKSRSLIFSTALPPANVLHTIEMLTKLRQMDLERNHLFEISKKLREGIQQITGTKSVSVSHIVPLIVGDADRVVKLSRILLDKFGILALPIRKPSVPAGTERIRFSLSAKHSMQDIEYLLTTLKQVMI